MKFCMGDFLGQVAAGGGNKKPFALSPLSLPSDDESLKNMTAKCLCHGTAKLHSSAPSPVNVITASSPAYTGFTLRMKRRVAGVHE